MATMVANAFKVGDVVMLNSGGPAMTITEVKDGFVVAVWFRDEYKLLDTFCNGSFYKVK